MSAVRESDPNLRGLNSAYVAEISESLAYSCRHSAHACLSHSGRLHSEATYF